MCCTVMYLLRFIEDIAVFLRVFVNFRGFCRFICEFHSSATVQNINEPKLSVTKAVNITKIFTSMTSTLIKSSKCTLYMYMPVKASPAWRKSKSACLNSLAVKSASIKGSRNSGISAKSREIPQKSARNISKYLSAKHI